MLFCFTVSVCLFMIVNSNRIQRQGFLFCALLFTALQSCMAQPRDRFSSAEELLGHTEAVIEIQLKTPNDIVPIKDSIVKPYQYDNGISLASLRTKEKKQKFFDMILPSILIAREALEKKYKAVDMIRVKQSKGLVLSEFETNFLAAQMKACKAKTIDDLLLRLRTHPTSIVMAQAALESGWGSSRFYLQANNIFGVHSFNSSEARVPASVKKDGKTSYVKKYDCIAASIEGYFKTLARGPYSNFRRERAKTDDPLQLIQYLTRYSVLKEEYVRRLSSVIVSNNLQQYDSYQLGEVE